MSKAPAVQSFLDDLSRGLTGRTTAEAVAAGTCIDCGLPFKGRVFTEDGAREVHISGMCEVCWDTLFADTEDE